MNRHRLLHRIIAGAAGAAAVLPTVRRWFRDGAGEFRLGVAYCGSPAIGDLAGVHRECPLSAAGNARLALDEPSARGPHCQWSLASANQAGCYALGIEPGHDIDLARRLLDSIVIAADCPDLITWRHRVIRSALERALLPI